MNNVIRTGILAGIVGVFLLHGACTQAEQPAKVKPLMKDFMGINGHTIGVNPALVTPVCRLIRDYHNIEWDILDDSSAPTQFPLAKANITWEDVSGNWQSHDGIINWEVLYGRWKQAGLEIDVCVQSAGFTFDKWKDPAADAYRYGKAFAEFFGPSGPTKLVSSVEIDNEPAGHYTTEDYRVIFENMARGVRAGDPSLTIVTATTAAGEPDRYSIPMDMFKEFGELYDVLNVHTYSMITGWPTWERSFPEDPSIEYLKVVQRAIEWRNTNATDKQIWITEFGYDASTQGPLPDGDFKGWMDVSDEVQAQWIVRSFLEFSALDVDRAYLFFLDDGDRPTLHESSGIMRHMEPKLSYYAMRHLYQTLGDYRFGQAQVKVAGDIYIYEYVHGQDATDRIWVIWSPTGSQREAAKTLQFPGTVVRAERMPMADGPAEVVDLNSLLVTESPVYVWLKMP